MGKTSGFEPDNVGSSPTAPLTLWWEMGELTKWWQVKLLRWGIRWQCLKAFKFPPKISKTTIWDRGGHVRILVYYIIKKKTFYKIVLSPKDEPLWKLAPQFFKAIGEKETFFRDSF